jgi:hypothetical protein
MAYDCRMSYAAVNAENDALGALADTGYLRIYTASRPATADAAATGTLLAELRFGADAFATSVSGVITANAITPDSSADNGGTAAWFRVLQSNGTTALWDGEVGTSASDLILNSVTIGAGATVSVTALTHTIPRS